MQEPDTIKGELKKDLEIELKHGDIEEEMMKQSEEATSDMHLDKDWQGRRHLKVLFGLTHFFLRTWGSSLVL